MNRPENFFLVFGRDACLPSIGLCAPIKFSYAENDIENFRTDKISILTFSCKLASKRILAAAKSTESKEFKNQELGVGKLGMYTETKLN